jgi:hypothetical protein
MHFDSMKSTFVRKMACFSLLLLLITLGCEKDKAEITDLFLVHTLGKSYQNFDHRLITLEEYNIKGGYSHSTNLTSAPSSSIVFYLTYDGTYYWSIEGYSQQNDDFPNLQELIRIDRDGNITEFPAPVGVDSYAYGIDYANGSLWMGVPGIDGVDVYTLDPNDVSIATKETTITPPDIFIAGFYIFGIEIDPTDNLIWLLVYEIGAGDLDFFKYDLNTGQYEGMLQYTYSKSWFFMDHHIPLDYDVDKNYIWLVDQYLIRIDKNDGSYISFPDLDSISMFFTEVDHDY